MKWRGVGVTGLLMVLVLAGCKTETPSISTDDGRHQFRATFSKFKFGVTLKAHHASVRDCHWWIETEPLAGLDKGEKPRVVEEGGFGRAKIKVEEPRTVKVFLVSKSCGVWE